MKREERERLHLAGGQGSDGGDVSDAPDDYAERDEYADLDDLDEGDPNQRRDAQRWRAIVDAETLGQAITPEDAAFRRSYEAAHPACAAETAAWGVLLTALAAPLEGERPAAAGEAEEDEEAAAAAVVAAFRSRRVAPLTAFTEGEEGEEGEGGEEGEASPEQDPTGHARVVVAQPHAVVAGAEAAGAGVVAALATRSGRRRGWRRGVSISGGLAVAASLLLALRFWGGGESPSGGATPELSVSGDRKVATAEHPRTPGSAREEDPEAAEAPIAALPPEVARIALIAGGDLRIDGEPAGVGAELRPGATLASGGDTCLVFTAPFASVCVGPGAHLTLDEARGGVRRLAVERGDLVAILDTLPPGGSFTVHGGAGEARAVGTVFAYRVGDGGHAEVGVIEGAIELRRPGVAEPLRRLRAGEHTTFAAAAAVTPLPEDLETWSKGHAATSELWRGLRTPATLELAATAATLHLDGRPLLPGDLALLVEAGEHTLELPNRPGAQGSRRLRVVGDPARVTALGGDELSPQEAPRRSGTRPPAGGGGDSAVGDAGPAVVSLAELRARALEARGAGAWREAAEAYRELLERYPATGEAHNARFQLGDLLRRRLGRPADAIAHFDAYLARGGPLAAEARYGKVLALQQLGRRTEEAAAVAEFLAHHPGHIEAAKLRLRAEELGPGAE